jgi:hypothetical protein
VLAPAWKRKQRGLIAPRRLLVAPDSCRGKGWGRDAPRALPDLPTGEEPSTEAVGVSQPRGYETSHPSYVFPNFPANRQVRRQQLAGISGLRIALDSPVRLIREEGQRHQGRR